MNTGQFVIFSERMIHGSGPNRTADTRTAMNFRLIPPYVKVYRGSLIIRRCTWGKSYSLPTGGTVLLRGTDEFGYNRRAPLEVKPRARRGVPA